METGVLLDMKYNQSQIQAIEHGEGPMLVVAGPGSGKTTVLTKRIQSLIEKEKVNPREILVITFTKAAAQEMKNRFHAMMESKTYVTFGTFHGVFFTILKAAYHFTGENVIKEDKRKYVLLNAIEKSRVDVEDKKEFCDKISAEISRVKSECLDINAYFSINCGESAFREIYNFYQESLKRARLIDFDDMLVYCYELFTQRPDILAGWQKRYRYILIDEFQDINLIQYNIIRMLAAPENNLFVVGDDDQSIYGFRGSKPEIMLGFDKIYPDVKKVILDKNYRSTGNIVAAAQRVISQNKTRYSKNIRTDNIKGDKVDIVEFKSIHEQYQRIIDEIRGGIQQGKTYKDYAVLYRTNSIAAPLVRKLIENNITFIMKDGIPNIYEHWISKDILTYMAIAAGSRKRSDFLQIMNRPKRYVARDYLSDEEVSFDELEKYYEDKQWMIDRLDRMQMDLQAMSTMSPFAMINYLRKAVGYDEFLLEYAQQHNIEVQELIDLADEIMDSAKNFKSYGQWLEYIADFKRELNQHTGFKKNDENAVSLITMHSAKGLEFHTVYIIDANEGITPHKKAVFELDIEEERRMFYVAMTRAKEKLNIFYTKERYNKKMDPSRFIEEVMD